MKQKLLLYITISCFSFLQAQLTPPQELQTYYSNVDFNLTGIPLYNDLAAETIAKHINILGYSERHNYLYDADKDLTNSDHVILMYNGESRDKREYLSGNNAYSPQTFNTEHVYPQSLIENTARGDLHHLRSCDVSINSSRGNNPFGSGSGSYGLVNSSWYPGDEWKGDVARMIFYLNVRYNEPFADIGSLALFLQWNIDDPVSDFERNRNEVIASAQGNRNPFIDNPYIATVIWGGAAAENTWATLGVEEQRLSNIKLYPNPTKINSITITVPNGLSINDISLYSVLGKRIYQSKKPKIKDHKIKIDKLKKGLYLLKIMNDTESVSKKVIVQ
ncbi:MAG: endonuclease [Polaribacter sp.]